MRNLIHPPTPQRGGERRGREGERERERERGREREGGGHGKLLLEFPFKFNRIKFSKPSNVKQLT